MTVIHSFPWIRCRRLTIRNSGRCITDFSRAVAVEFPLEWEGDGISGGGAILCLVEPLILRSHLWVFILPDSGASLGVVLWTSHLCDSLVPLLECPGIHCWFWAPLDYRWPHSGILMGILPLQMMSDVGKFYIPMGTFIRRRLWEVFFCHSVPCSPGVFISFIFSLCLENGEIHFVCSSTFLNASLGSSIFLEVPFCLLILGYIVLLTLFEGSWLLLDILGTVRLFNSVDRWRTPVEAKYIFQWQAFTDTVTCWLINRLMMMWPFTHFSFKWWPGDTTFYFDNY